MSRFVRFVRGNEFYSARGLLVGFSPAQSLGQRAMKHPPIQGAIKTIHIHGIFDRIQDAILVFIIIIVIAIILLNLPNIDVDDDADDDGGRDYFIVIENLLRPPSATTNRGKSGRVVEKKKTIYCIVLHLNFIICGILIRVGDSF